MNDKTYVMTKSLSQRYKAMRYLENTDEAYLILYGTIEEALYIDNHGFIKEKYPDEYKMPILITFHITERERDTVSESWEYIENIK